MFSFPDALPIIRRGYCLLITVLISAGAALASSQLHAASVTQVIEEALAVETNTPLTSYQECLLREINAAVSETAHSIKLRCQHQEAKLPEGITAYEQRKQGEISSAYKPFTLLPHKPNYLLPITHHFSDSRETFAKEGSFLDKTEVSFQVSLKFPVINDILGTEMDIMAAYTGRSFWQAYNSDLSAPFRDTNHEPEIFLNQPINEKIGKLYWRDIQYGFSHQSNGRTVPISRSWNRVYANFLFSYKNFAWSFKPWYRIREDKKENSDDVLGDDNPDIEHYLGHFELQSTYKWHDHTLSAMVRNNLRSDNKGALRLNWSFPLTPKIKGYVYYFNGYGETMVDYNNETHSLGVGFLLSDWL